MANLLLDIIRSLAAGAIGDKIKEEASPYVEDIMREAPPEKPMTEGYRYDDRGFPTRSSMIPAQTSGYVRPRADGVRGEAADPYVLDQMMREAVGEQRTREGELAQAMADEAAQKRASVLDFVRQAGQGTGTAQTAPYTPSGDDSAMFSSPNVQRMMMNPRIQATSAKIAEEAPELTPKQNLAATALEEVKKEGMLRKAKRAAGAPVQEGSTDMALGMYPNGKPDESSSFFDEISGGLKDLFGTRDGWIAIGAAANELRFAPSDAIRQGNQKIYEKRMEVEAANKSIPMLEKINPQLAAMVKAGAITAKEALTLAYKNPTKLQQMLDLISTPEGRAQLEQFKAMGIDPFGGTTINMPSTQRGLDDELRSELIKDQAKAFSTLTEQGLAAMAVQTEMDDLAQVMEMVPTGAATGRFLEMFPEADSNAAVAMSMIKRIAPTLRVAGSGSTSDIEYAGMLGSLGSFRNDPEANRMIFAAMRNKQAILVEQAKLVEQFRNNEIDGKELSKRMFELKAKSIFDTPEMKQKLLGSDAAKQAMSDQGAAKDANKGAYPVGTVLTKPDGSTAVKVKEGDDNPSNWEVRPPKGAK